MEDLQLLREARATGLRFAFSALLLLKTENVMSKVVYFRSVLFEPFSILYLLELIGMREWEEHQKIRGRR